MTRIRAKIEMDFEEEDDSSGDGNESDDGGRCGYCYDRGPTNLREVLKYS